MRINYNKFLSLVYADIFDWPLTQSELRDWRISDKKKITKQVEYKNGYYFLPGKGKLAQGRVVKEKISARKKIIAEIIAGFLVKIPTIEAIFLTGSVAVGSAKKNGDIDLMIITSPNTLWLTRVVVVVLLKVLKSYGNSSDRICPNIFLDTNHLEIKERNLYTAHEILQAACLFDRNRAESKWLRENSWTANYLPVASKIRRTEAEKRRSSTFPRVSEWIPRILVPLELSAYGLQYLYMRQKITNERLGWGYAFFHPENLSGKVVRKFISRLA